MTVMRRSATIGTVYTVYGVYMFAKISTARHTPLTSSKENISIAASHCAQASRTAWSPYTLYTRSS